MQKVGMPKTLEILVFGVPGSQKISLMVFFKPPRCPPDCSKPATLSFGSPEVAQNAPWDRPGTLQAAPWTLPGQPRGSLLTLRAPVQDSAAAQGDLEHLGKAPGTKKRSKTVFKIQLQHVRS